MPTIWVLTNGASRPVAEAFRRLVPDLPVREFHDARELLDALGDRLPAEDVLAIQGGCMGTIDLVNRRYARAGTPRRPIRLRYGVFSIHGLGARRAYDTGRRPVMAATEYAGDAAYIWFLAALVRGRPVGDPALVDRMDRLGDEHWRAFRAETLPARRRARAWNARLARARRTWSEPIAVIPAEHVDWLRGRVASAAAGAEVDELRRALRYRPALVPHHLATLVASRISIKPGDPLKPSYAIAAALATVGVEAKVWDHGPEVAGERRRVVFVDPLDQLLVTRAALEADPGIEVVDRGLSDWSNEVRPTDTVLVEAVGTGVQSRVHVRNEIEHLARIGIEPPRVILLASMGMAASRNDAHRSAATMTRIVEGDLAKEGLSTEVMTEETFLRQELGVDPELYLPMADLSYARARERSDPRSPRR